MGNQRTEGSMRGFADGVLSFSISGFSQGYSSFEISKDGGAYSYRHSQSRLLEQRENQGILNKTQVDALMAFLRPWQQRLVHLLQFTSARRRTMEPLRRTQLARRLKCISQRFRKAIEVFGRRIQLRGDETGGRRDLRRTNRDGRPRDAAFLICRVSKRSTEGSKTVRLTTVFMRSGCKP